MTDPLPSSWWKESAAALSSRVYTYHDPATDSLLLTWDRVRPAQVVGIEIEALQPLALRRHPSWQRFVDIAGVDEFKRAEPADYPAIAAFIAEIASLPLA